VLNAIVTNEHFDFSVRHFHENIGCEKTGRVARLMELDPNTATSSFAGGSRLLMALRGWKRME